MSLITVFTPTYNRAHLLPRLYESLKQQTSKNFVWMVVDDGSVDDTKILVNKWILENLVDIKYFYKKNGGMHTAHNLAYSAIDTELNLCIDSDDWMPNDAISKIELTWNSYKDTENIGGIVALDADENLTVLGSVLPSGVESTSFTKLYQYYKVTGDKKVILRTDILKKFPQYPEYRSEKLVPLGSLYMLISERYDFICLNEIVCCVEYQVSGSSNTIMKQYFQSPKGFAYARKIKLKYYSSYKEIIKNCLHLISIGVYLKDFKIIFKNNPYKVLTVFLFPIGIMFNAYLRHKVKI